MRLFRTFFDQLPQLPALIVLVLLLSLALVLTGCGGNSASAGGGAVPLAADATPVDTTAVFSGSVGDGPVTGATVQVFSNSGSLLGSVVTDSSAGFTVTIKARGNEYPLRLEVRNGVDLVTGTAPDFTLVSVLLKPSDKQANINPFTTLMTRVAERLPGGLTAANIDQARTLVLNKTAFGLDTRVITNPFTATIDNSNAAQLVKASEGLGEWIRRIRDLSGRAADTVVNALAGDLTDGYLDGLGGTGTDARISAIANVAASQVTVELLGDHLQVGGVEATAIMDQALRSTHPGIAGSQLTASVRITAQLIAQSAAAIAAARVLDNSSAVQAVASTVAGLKADSTSSTVSSVLPAGSSSALRTAVLLAPGATSAEISSINQLVFASTDTTTTTTPAGGGGAISVTGTLSLNWTPPSTRSDGTPIALSDIGGYRIYYGSAHASYGNQLTIMGNTTTSVTLSSLVSGNTYYLVMTTVDASGLESGYSPEISKKAL